MRPIAAGDTSYALGLTARQVRAVMLSSELDEQLRSDRVDFTVLGIDRLWGRRMGGDVADDPFIAAAAIGSRIGPVGLLGAASPATDHPYNLSRRVASVDHMLEGHGGLVLGERDAYGGAPPTTARRPAALTPSLISSPGVATTADAALAIVRLWQSWADDALVADPASRSFADVSRIRRIGHHGAFSIDGPSTLPASPQGTPVLGWYVSTEAEATAAVELSDVLVFGDSRLAAQWIRGRPAAARRAPVRSYLERRLDPLKLAAGRAETRPAGGVDGLLLTFPSASLAELAIALRSIPAGARATAATLRRRLGLPRRPDLLGDAVSAFGPADAHAATR